MGLVKHNLHMYFNNSKDEYIFIAQVLVDLWIIVY